MSVIFIILPLAIVMAGAAIAAFIWAVRQGQFDDMDTPAYRAFLDDESPARPRAGGANGNGTPGANGQGNLKTHN